MTFDVEANPAKNRITVTLTGFATLDDVKDLELQLADAHQRMPKYRGPHQFLYDVSGAKIQSQDVVNALRQLATHSVVKSAFALVNASALAGRQLDRIFAGIELRRCRDLQDAHDWLDAQAVAAQPTQQSPSSFPSRL